MMMMKYDGRIYFFKIGQQNYTYPIKINNTAVNFIIGFVSAISMDETTFKSIKPTPQYVYFGVCSMFWH